MTKEEIAATKSEIAAYKYLLKKLEKAESSISKKATDIKAAREKRYAELMEYKTEGEIEDAYGWDIITDDERRELIERLEGNQKAAESEKSKEEMALAELEDFMYNLKHLSNSLEFELLPDKEKDRITRENEELQLRVAARLSQKRGEREATP